MAIYEAIQKGKITRTYEIVSTKEAVDFYKRSNNVLSAKNIVDEEKKGIKLRCIVKKGTHIILLQHDNEKIDLKDKLELSKRIYTVAIIFKDGRIILRHQSEARESSIIKKERKAGAYVQGEEYRAEISMSLSNFNALVEGTDFEITSLGEIRLKK